jgi:hypothetical protein
VDRSRRDADHPLARHGFKAQADETRADVGGIEIDLGIGRSIVHPRAASAAAQAKSGGLSQQMINEKIFQLTPAELLQEQQYKQTRRSLQRAAGA